MPRFRSQRHGFLVLVLVLSLLSGCSETQEPPEEIVRSIKTISVSRRPIGQLRRLFGVLSASDESELSFQVGGHVQSVAVDAGDRVRAGQLLASLDAQPYQLRLDSSIADLQSARARLQDTRMKVTSTRSLYKRQIASKQAFDSAQSAFDSAESSVQAAEAAVSLAQRDLDQTVLVAPIEGLIAERRLEPFQEISPGTAVLLIQSQGGIEVDIRMPETLVHEVQSGQNVIVRMTTRTFSGKEFEGRVTKVGALSLDSNAYPVTIALAESDPRMRPGMTARVDFNFAGSVDETGWLIPINAVLPGDDVDGDDRDAHITERDAYVFVYQPDSSTVERRTVRISGLRGDSAEIRDGLKEGDVVAVAGVHFLVDGQRVALIQDGIL
jgi:multidrug efflux system membrane fusion protein